VTFDELNCDADFEKDAIVTDCCDAMCRCCSSLATANCDGGGRGDTDPAFGGLLTWSSEDGVVVVEVEEI